MIRRTRAVPPAQRHHACVAFSRWQSETQQPALSLSLSLCVSLSTRVSRKQVAQNTKGRVCSRTACPYSKQSNGHIPRGLTYLRAPPAPFVK
jgi:hypothetical protein